MGDERLKASDFRNRRLLDWMSEEADSGQSLTLTDNAPHSLHVERQAARAGGEPQSLTH